MNAALLEALLDGPALAPPPGYTSNLIDPPKHVLASYFPQSVAIFLSTLAVGLRMYTRIWITKQVNYADYTLLLGWALFACFVAMVYLIVKYNPGVHQWDISVRDLRSMSYWYHIAAVEYGLIICSVKFSILAQYIQIFMPTKKPSGLYWLTVFLMGANVVAYIIFTFLEIFACYPIDKAWDPLITHGKCVIDLRVLNTAASAVNTGSDFIILAIPQLVIWRLKMRWKNKVSLSMVFMVAILAIISSVIRLYYCVELEYTEDIAYYTWISGAWALPEIMFGIVVASLPALRPFFREFSKSPLYKTISSSLQKIVTRTATRTRGRNLPKGPISNDSYEMRSWHPKNSKSGSGMTWVDAAYGGEAITGSASGSMEGLRVETTFEATIERERV